MTTRPSFTICLRHAVLAALFGTALIGVIATYMPASDAVLLEADTAPSEVQVDAQATRVDRLLERHSCWSGDAPADMVGVIPPRAVVTLPGERAQLVDGGVGLAIVFEGKAGVVHGFCREGERSGS